MLVNSTIFSSTLGEILYSTLVLLYTMYSTIHGIKWILSRRGGCDGEHHAGGAGYAVQGESYEEEEGQKEEGGE